MAWTCSSGTNSGLIANLARNGIIKTPRIRQAFEEVDRKYYVAHRDQAYADNPSSIGFNATISAPHMHAAAVEHLEAVLHPGDHVLDIGSGSGYLLSIFHKLVDPGGVRTGGGGRRGTVLGIDHLSEIVDLARSNLSRDPTVSHLLAPPNSPPSPSHPISNIVGDGRIGAPAKFVPAGGFSAIHVGAAAPEIPQALVDQLAKPGIMFIPVGRPHEHQAIWEVAKDREGRVTKKRLFGVSYIPLTDADSQRSNMI